MANETARRLRKEATPAERLLWRDLRELKRDGCHFRRQVPLKGFIVDFVCFARRLVIEVDGGHHGEEPMKPEDQIRDARLRQDGYQVLRFWNPDVLKNAEGVVASIRSVLGLDRATLTLVPSPQGGGKRCPLPLVGRGRGGGL